MCTKSKEVDIETPDSSVSMSEESGVIASKFNCSIEEWPETKGKGLGVLEVDISAATVSEVVEYGIID